MPNASPALNVSSPFTSLHLDHAGIDVPDFDAAIAWYTEKLDFRVRQKFPVGDRMFAFISPAADDSFRIELMAGPGASLRPPYADLASSHNLQGWHHLCFRVDDVNDVVAELKRRGVTIVSSPMDVPSIGLRFAFFSDPWGNLFELIQQINRQQ